MKDPIKDPVKDPIKDPIKDPVKDPFKESKAPAVCTAVSIAHSSCLSEARAGELRGLGTVEGDICSAVIGQQSLQLS